MDYYTGDGTAGWDEGDYQRIKSGRLNIPAGETEGTITVIVNGDTIIENDEWFWLNLKNPVNADVADYEGMGVIENDDGLPGLTIGDCLIVEGSGDSATFIVTLSRPSTRDVTVDYVTREGSAQASDGDYVSVTGRLTIPAGVTSGQVIVGVVDDDRLEPDESFLIDLSHASGAMIADGEGLGTIQNDDLSRLWIDDVALSEGDNGTKAFTFTVRLSETSGQAVNVLYTTKDGTATAGSDYEAKSDTLMIPAGQTTGTIIVTVNGDKSLEPDETFYVKMSSVSNATIADSQGVGTIRSDDLVLMGFRLELQDASGTRIEPLQDAEGNVLLDEDGDPILPVVVGDEFRLQVCVDDLRTVSDPQGGVYAGALDVAYSDPSLFSLNGTKPDAFTDLEAFKSFFTTHSILHDFGNGPVVVPMYSQDYLKVYPSALNHDGETVPTQNEFDELYGIASALELCPYDAGEVPFVYVTLKADSVGKLTFAGNPADATSPMPENLVFGLTETIPASEIDFGLPVHATIMAFPPWRFGSPQPIGIPNYRNTAVAADLDGDGDADLLSESDGGGPEWYENLGNGQFGSQKLLAPGLGLQFSEVWRWTWMVTQNSMC